MRRVLRGCEIENDRGLRKRVCSFDTVGDQAPHPREVLGSNLTGRQSLSDFFPSLFDLISPKLGLSTRCTTTCEVSKAIKMNS